MNIIAKFNWAWYVLGAPILNLGSEYLKPYIKQIILQYKFRKSAKYMKSKYKLGNISGYKKNKKEAVAIIENMKKQKNTK